MSNDTPTPKAWADWADQNPEANMRTIEAFAKFKDVAESLPSYDQQPNWLALQAKNPAPSLLDAIEFATGNDPKDVVPGPRAVRLHKMEIEQPKRRVRIIHDSSPSDPREDDNVCQIEGDYDWRTRSRVDHIIELIRDTDAWRSVERLLAAANPDWTDDDGPDLYDNDIRQQWLDKLTDCLLTVEFSAQSYSYLAHTTPEMCAKLGVEWEHAERAMAGEVEAFKMWAEGDVYGFVVEEWRKECGCDDCEAGEWEETDSCWGFYGSDPFENGMSEHIDEELHDMLRAAEVEY